MNPQGSLFHRLVDLFRGVGAHCALPLTSLAKPVLLVLAVLPWLAPLSARAAKCGSCNANGTVDLPFHAEGTAPPFILTMTMKENIGEKNVEISGQGALLTETKTLQLKPETTYKGKIKLDRTDSTASSGSFARAVFEVPCGWTLEISSRTNPSIDESSEWSGWEPGKDGATVTGSAAFELTMEIEIKLKMEDSQGSGNGGHASATETVSAASIPAAEQDGTPDSSGQPATISPVAFNASIPMGATVQSAGFNTGSLILSGSISAALANVVNLSVNGENDGLTVVRDSSGNVRQVTNLTRLADVVTISGGGFEIRMYESGSFSTTPASGPSGLYPINSGAAPYETVNYVPVVASSGHFGGIRTTTTGPDGVSHVRDTLVTALGGTSWRTVDDSGLQVVDQNSIFTHETDGWHRFDLAIVTRNGLIYSKNQQDYLYQIRKEGSPAVVAENHLFQLEDKVYGAESSIATTTTWVPDSSVLGRPAQMTRSDGYWEVYHYYTGAESGANASMKGLLRETLRPWNGTPTDPSTASSANAESTVVTYQALPTTPGVQPGRRSAAVVTTRPSSGSPVIVSKRENISSSVNVSSLTGLLTDAGLASAWSPSTASIRSQASRTMASATEWLYSYSLSYDSVVGAGSPWQGASFASLDEKGNGTVIGYERGTYNASTGAFTANNPTGSSSGWGSDVRSLTVKVMNFGAPADFERTCEVSIEDRFGKPLRKDLRIKDTSAWNLATSTTWEYPQLFADGSAKETLEKHDGRIVRHETITSSREATKSDEQGVTITTVSDALGRTVSSTRSGVSAGGGHEAQSDVITSYAYSGGTTTTTVSAEGFSQTMVSVADLAGRTISAIDASGATTLTSYPNGGRDTLVTLPGGLTCLTTRSIDGLTVSVTGSAVIDQTMAYEIDSAGNLLTTIRTGEVTNSPRYSKTLVDPGGRILQKISPDPAPPEYSLGPNVVISTYVPGTRDLATRQSSNVNYFFAHPSAYSSLTQSGSKLYPGSTWDRAMDPVTETRGYYTLEGGYWWETSFQKQYDLDNDTTSTVASVTKRCLHGQPGFGLAAKSVSIAPTGETVTTVTAFDRSAKTRMVTTTFNGSSNSAVAVNCNGLEVSSLGFEGGNPTTWTYDAFGRKMTETSSRGAVSRMTYAANGQVATTVDAYNQVTRYDYYGPSHPSAGKVARITRPGGTTTTYRYDALGNVTETAGTGEYRVIYEYDGYGQCKKMSTWRTPGTPDTTEWVYQDGTGLLKEKKYADGNKVSYTYTASGKVQTRTWARGVTTTYVYWAGDLLQKVTYSDGTPSVTFWDWDRLGRPRRISKNLETYSIASTERLGYQAGTGVLESRYFENDHPLMPGLGIQYSTPDSAGRSTGYSETSGGIALTAQHTVGYSYDTAGRLDTLTDGTQTHIYGYAGGTSQVISLESRNSGTTWFKESRQLDTAGRLIGIRSDRMSNATTVLNRISTYAYGYDELGRRTQATLQDGSRWDYGYNDRSEVTSAARKNSSGTVVPQLGATYAYDGIGNRTASNSAVLGDHTYTANNLNQYTTVTTSTGRTAVGRAPAAWSVEVYPSGGTATTASRIDEFYYQNLTAANSSAPVWQSVVTRRSTGTPTSTGNLWYAKQSITPTYDADGNLTNDGRWVYTWDAENRLTQMETTTAATAAGHPYTKLAFVYDWQGHRIERAVWQGGTSGSPTFSSRRRWIYDGWNPIVEFDSNAAGTTNTRLNTYLWGLDVSGTMRGAGGVGGLITQTSVSGPVVRHPSYDGNGNIVGWTRSDEAMAECRREYDAFGNVLISEGQAPSEYGFSTKMQDAETGLLYYGYRYYDLSSGRWVGRDPMWEKGGVNLYAFTNNNGVNHIDVLGNVTHTDKKVDTRFHLSVYLNTIHNGVFTHHDLLGSYEAYASITHIADKDHHGQRKIVDGYLSSAGSHINDILWWGGSFGEDTGGRVALSVSPMGTYDVEDDCHQCIFMHMSMDVALASKITVTAGLSKEASHLGASVETSMNAEWEKAHAGWDVELKLCTDGTVRKTLKTISWYSETVDNSRWIYHPTFGLPGDSGRVWLDDVTERRIDIQGSGGGMAMPDGEF